MKYKLTIAIFSFLIFSYSASSQRDFREGFIVKKNDTIYGLVDYRGDKKSTNICTFKKDKNSKIKEYEPDQITGYGFIGSKAYVSKYANEGLNVKPYFLEYLVKGFLSIYYFRDDKDRYFVEKEGELIQELRIIKDLSVGYNQYKLKKEYIGILKYLTKECTDLHPQIESSKLDHKSLIDIAKKYNDCVCKECIIFVKPKTWISIKATVFSGFSSSKMDFIINANNRYALTELDNYEETSIFPEKIFNLDNTFPVSTSFPIGLEANIILPRLNEKISLQTGLNFVKHYYQLYSEIDGYTTNFGIHAYYLKNPVALRYTYPRYKLKPFIESGIYNNFVVRTNSRLLQIVEQTDFISVSHDTKVNTYKYQLSFFAGGGFQYEITKRNSLFLGARYERGKNLLKGNLTNLSILVGITF